MIELILNPIAGNGRAKRALGLVEKELQGRGLEYRVSRTGAQGEATELAKKAVADGCTAVGVLGGDGLLSEVAAALMGTGVRLYVIPCGTGNDFAKSVRLKKDPIEALRLQLEHEDLAIDCGMMNEFTFMNIAGVGFDIEVLRQTEKVKKRLHGVMAYAYGLVVGLKNYRPFVAEVVLDGVSEHRSYTIVAVANGRCFGGGMKVAPRAKLSDGVFDVMLVEALPKWKFYLLVPFFPMGWYVRFRSVVRRVKAKEVVIKAEKAFTVEVDGELKEVTRAHFRCVENGIVIACEPLA